jgi:hypothetical protein
MNALSKVKNEYFFFFFFLFLTQQRAGNLIAALGISLARAAAKPRSGGGISRLAERAYYF